MNPRPIRSGRRSTLGGRSTILDAAHRYQPPGTRLATSRESVLATVRLQCRPGQVRRLTRANFGVSRAFLLPRTVRTRAPSRLPDQQRSLLRLRLSSATSSRSLPPPCVFSGRTGQMNRAASRSRRTVSRPLAAESSASRGEFCTLSAVPIPRAGHAQQPYSTDV